MAKALGIKKIKRATTSPNKTIRQVSGGDPESLLSSALSLLGRPVCTQFLGPQPSSHYFQSRLFQVISAEDRYPVDSGPGAQTLQWRGGAPARCSLARKLAFKQIHSLGPLQLVGDCSEKQNRRQDFNANLNEHSLSEG